MDVRVVGHVGRGEVVGRIGREMGKPVEGAQFRGYKACTT